ncbi:MAG: hypothetical protein ABIL20_05675 [candidate division WOR-3 bacterium]
MGELIRFWKVSREHEAFFTPFETDFAKFLFEEYQNEKYDRKLKLFYAVKFLIPRVLQISLRRIKARYIRNDFPHWPIETYLEDFKREILKNMDKGIPFIWYWPNNNNFALCLTHDVETKEGLRKINKICEIEKKFGLRSAWYFVGEKYLVSDNLIKELKEQGFEVGIHGLRHDGKLFNSRHVFNERKERIKYYVEKWDARGFRSPSLLRNVKWLQELPFQYDSSFPDADPFGPQPGGCLSIFPFFLGNLVELPVTMPQDHTLYEILGQKDISIWRNKIEWIERMHGLALIIVHPDYFSKEVEKYYYEFLNFALSKKDLWCAKPIEISKWWRDRDNSDLLRDKQNRFVITGPAEKQGGINYLENLFA